MNKVILFYASHHWQIFCHQHIVTFVDRTHIEVVKEKIIHQMRLALRQSQGKAGSADKCIAQLWR